MTVALTDGALVAVDFISRSGDDFVIKATTKDKAGTVVNITGAVIKFGMYDGPILGSEKFNKTVGSGIVITDGPNGLYEVTVLPADTAALDGRYYHETEMILGGKTRTVMVGTVVVKGDRVNP